MDEKLRSDESLRLLNNDVLRLALKDLRELTVEQWAACPARDTEGREWLWMFYQNTMRFEEVLKGYLAKGKIDDFNRRQDGLMRKVSNIFKR